MIVAVGLKTASIDFEILNDNFLCFPDIDNYLKPLHVY